MHEFCKEYVDKKNKIGTAIDLEVSDLSGANNNNAAIDNERHGIFHNNSYEGNTAIANERYYV